MIEVMFQGTKFLIFQRFWQVYCAWFNFCFSFCIILSKKVGSTISSLLPWSVSDFHNLIVELALITQSFPQSFIVSSRFADPEKF